MDVLCRHELLGSVLILYSASFDIHKGTKAMNIKTFPGNAVVPL